MSRRAVSLVEVLVAVAVLAAASAAMMGLVSGEARLTRLSLERFIAQQLLGELEAAFAGRSPRWFADRGFPVDEAAWGALHDTLLDEYPLLTPPRPDERPLGATEETLREAIVRLGVERRVLFLPGTPGDPLDPPRIEMVVRYRPPDGAPRELRSLRVLR